MQLCIDQEFKILQDLELVKEIRWDHRLIDINNNVKQNTTVCTLLPLLIQFPPSLKIKEGLEALDRSDFYLDDTYRYYCFSHITLLPYCQIHKVIPFRSNELVICIVVTPERLDTTQWIKLAIKYYFAIVSYVCRIRS